MKIFSFFITDDFVRNSDEICDKSTYILANANYIKRYLFIDSVLHADFKR